tara:strand:+ start:242 stop:940 length:699 start_codon:yes stop_codon:yes gene_type:complete
MIKFVSVKRLLLVICSVLISFIYSQSQQTFKKELGHWVSISGGYQHFGWSGFGGWIGRRIPFEFNYMLRYHLNKSFFMSFKPGFYFIRNFIETSYGEPLGHPSQFLPTTILSIKTVEEGLIIATHSPILVNLKKKYFTLKAGFDFIYPFGRYSYKNTEIIELVNGDISTEEYTMTTTYDEFRLLSIIGLNITVGNQDELGLKTSLRLNNNSISLYTENPRELTFQLNYNHKF